MALVAVPDRYDFEFLIKATKRKHRTEINRKVPKSFQSYLKNLNNKINLVKYLLQIWRETICVANLDANTKIFGYIKFLCDNMRLNKVIIVSPDTNVAVVSLCQSVTNK